VPSSSPALASGSGPVEPGQSFDRAALEYERARPGWPEEALELVPVPAAATVLDLGAGTGKLTRVLTRRYARVIAVEPLPALREILAHTVPDAKALEGRAEAIPLDDASVDAVFAGQAFHWFANDEAVAEIRRVLQPDGVLVLLWNEAVAPSPLPELYRARLDELRESVSFVSPEEGREVLARGGFEELQTASVEHEQVSTREEVLAFAASASWVAHRPEEERGQILAELATMLPEGEYRFPMRTEVNWTRRAPA
jgi:ubiquinone/menaquinone biosynthesis C-methylase UbiE